VTRIRWRPFAGSARPENELMPLVAPAPAFTSVSADVCASSTITQFWARAQELVPRGLAFDEIQREL